MRYEDPDTTSIAAAYRAYLQQVVSLHTVMFERLLFKEIYMPLELADLFEDAGQKYLKLSAMLNENYSRQDLQIKKHLEP